MTPALISDGPASVLFSSERFTTHFVTLPLDETSGSTASPPRIYTLFSPAANKDKNKVLLLLHGYPQNHTLWSEVASLLQETDVYNDYTVIIPDLPGYGLSTKTPSPDGSHLANSKQSVARNMIQLVDTLTGSTDSKLVVVGHDRGARVVYRMSKDYRDRVIGCCVQDIVPTKYVFESMKLFPRYHVETFKSAHWIFLAQPSPLPETLIGANPNFYITQTIDGWTGKRHHQKFNPIAMASWVGQYDSPLVIQGALEDYRAGASIDLDHDIADEETVRGDGTEADVTCDLLVLFSVHLSRRFNVARIWEKLAKKGLRSVKVGDEQTGHFLPVEAIEQTTQEMVDWMKTLQFL